MNTVTRTLIAVTAVATLTVTSAWAQPQVSRISVPAGAAALRKGLTWKLLSTNPATGTIDVGCTTGCDATNGDTPCTTALPILCIKKSGPGFPLALPAGVNNSDRYHKWSGGVVGTTSPTVPPATLAGADDLCVKSFGADWRVAEFHDGWGWHFQAFGGVGNPAQNFWVHINDQRGAICWQ